MFIAIATWEIFPDSETDYIFIMLLEFLSYRFILY